jgi:Ca2+-binding RTX toxin-like protein
MAVVKAFLIGCAVLLGVGCAGGVRSEAPKEQQQERTKATRANGRSFEATASEEVARCEGTRTFQTGGGPFTTNDLPGCPKGGLLAGTNKADKLGGKDGDDEIRSLGGADDLIIGGAGNNDVIYGGPGDDATLSGEEGNDVVYGGDGDDGLEEFGGTDVIYGGDGDDNITAWADDQRDKIYCGKGKDSYVADKHDYVSSDCEKKQEVTRMF